jgi:hypothetical protein
MNNNSSLTDTPCKEIYQPQKEIMSSNTSSNTPSIAISSTKKLAMDFLPFFIFHKDEQEFPIEINNKTLKDTQVYINNMPAVKSPDVDYLLKITTPNSSIMWDENSLHQKFNPENCFIYYTYTPPSLFSTDKNARYGLLQYIFIYRVNDGYTCCGNVLGYHQGDIEHISIYINQDKEQAFVEKVYFSAHGGCQGQWKNRDQLKFYKNERIFAYIARGSHAVYPTSGTQWRIFGVANDKCGGGIEWDVDPLKMIELDEKNPLWVSYRGYLGYPDNCRPPVNSGWFRHENGREIPAYKRFFACFQKYWWCGDDL